MKKWIVGLLLVLAILSVGFIVAACGLLEDDCGGGTCPVVSNPYTDPASQPSD